MEELRQTFLADSIANLRNLRTELQLNDNFSAETRRELFRALHTIKGTAQTFGLTAAARLAHTLENVLTAGGRQDEPIPADEAKTLLTDGIKKRVLACCW